MIALDVLIILSASQYKMNSHEIEKRFVGRRDKAGSLGKKEEYMCEII